MIKCPKCGADNMMNAIFCRQCGDKLDLASLKIEDQLGLNDEGSKAKKAQQKVNQIVAAVLAGIIVLLICALLIPPTGRLACEGTPSGEAEDKLKQLQEPKEDSSIEFTEQEVTDLLNKMYSFPKEGENSILPSGISVRAFKDGIIKVVMKSTVWGFLPMNASFTCKPTVGEKGNVTFEEHSGFRLGWIPGFLPDAVTDSFVERFRAAESSEESSAFFKARRDITAITVEEGKITFKVAKHVSPTKPNSAKTGVPANKKGASTKKGAPAKNAAQQKKAAPAPKASN